MKSIWVCQEHYDHLCESVGHEIGIMLIYNAFKNKCEYCEKIAEHYIDEPKVVLCDGGGKA